MPANATVIENQQQNQDKAITAKLRETLVSPYPDNKLPLSISVNYQDVEGKGPLLSASIQVPGEFIVFGPEGDKTQALLDVAGAFFNDRGQSSVTFFERIVSTAPSAEAPKTYRPDITYTYPASLAPGLYQARIAVRDFKSGRAGSARAWI